MKYYTRTTHNFNNDTREWEYRRELDKTQQSQHLHLKSTLGLHALDSGHWECLMWIVQKNKDYYNQYKDDPYGGCHEYGHSEEAVLHDLEEMEKAGLVKNKEG